MSYKISAKNRKFKGRIIKFLRALKFKWNNSSLYFKLIFSWNILLIISLFTSWSYTLNMELQNNAFSLLSGLSWYILIAIRLANLFVIISNSKKESLKLNLPFKIDEVSFVLFSAISQLLIISIVFFFIRWLLTFSENIVYWKWIILAFMWAFINIAWAVIMNRYFCENREDFLVSNNSNWDEDVIRNHIIDKNNMKLPF